MQDYLGPLLHEMVHAVFELYCCWWCPGCLVTYDNAVGVAGHDLLRQTTALAIEEALNGGLKALCGYKICLGRSWSLVLEYRKRYNVQYWTPSDVYRSLEIDGPSTAEIEDIFRQRRSG